MRITKEQARRFLLMKHGLLGPQTLRGKAGILEYVRRCGCIQFDPIDICGKNAELIFQARVKGFTREMLWELLYKDRLLVDYPDKNMSIFPVEDWPYFERFRRAAIEGGKRFEGLDKLEDTARRFIRENGPASGDEMPIEGKFWWKSSVHWSNGKNAARAALEQMYSTGEMIIHHKEGSRKSYDFAEKYIPAEILNASDPCPDEPEHIKWRIRRRIGAVGLLWNRPSDAWLNIWELNTEKRNAAFAALEAEGGILAVEVEGIRGGLYCLSEDAELLESVLAEERKDAKDAKKRCEFIAPLDCLMWDRKLIKALFDFEYSWEIYTPEAKRKYGYYVLPVLYGDRFIGRAEPVRDSKNGTLVLKNFWPEEGVKKTKQIQTALEGCMKRLAALNGLENISL